MTALSQSSARGEWVRRTRIVAIGWILAACAAATEPSASDNVEVNEPEPSPDTTPSEASPGDENTHGTDGNHDGEAASPANGSEGAKPKPEAATSPEDDDTAAPVPTPEPAPAQAPTLAPGTEFISWEDFEVSGTSGPMGDTGPLAAPLDVRSVSATRGYDGETLLIAVSSETGNNRVVALNTSARTLRDHWPHFACGDCRSAEGPFGDVIATATTLYGSTDGGYRYFEIASGDFSGLTTLSVANDQVWLSGPFGWLGAPLASRGPLSSPPWSAAPIVSVEHDSALEVTAETVILHAATEARADNPCPVARDDYGWGSAKHRADHVVLGCAENTVMTTDRFPDGFEPVELDGAALWVGSDHVATETSWFGVTMERNIYPHPALAAAERVFGYIESEDALFRITSHGVTVTPLSAPPP